MTKDRPVALVTSVGDAKFAHRVWFSVSLLLFLSACLSPDPETDLHSTSRDDTDSGRALTYTSAPLEIDPFILEHRRFGEALDLAEKVRLGELPPVSERLPENPLVVVPMEEIGRYGGTLNRALTGDIVQTPGVSKTIGEN